MFCQVRPSVEGKFPKLLPGPIRNFYGDVALGNGTQWRVGAFKTLSGIFIGIEGRGACLFQGPVTPVLVATYFRDMGSADAGNVADLINDQLDGERRPRYGRYESGLCDAAGDADEF